jgi:hypothetical protein
MPDAGARSVADEPAGRASIRRLAWHFAVVLSSAAALAALVGGPKSGISAALGVSLAGANLLLMRRITSALANASGASAAWAIALPFKLVALVGIAYALVHLRVAQPVPLAMGFALLPLTGVFLPRTGSVRHPDSARLSPRGRRKSSVPGSAVSHPAPAPPGGH